MIDPKKIFERKYTMIEVEGYPIEKEVYEKIPKEVFDRMISSANRAPSGSPKERIDIVFWRYFQDSEYSNGGREMIYIETTPEKMIQIGKYCVAEGGTLVELGIAKGVGYKIRERDSEDPTVRY